MPNSKMTAVMQPTIGGDAKLDLGDKHVMQAIPPTREYATNIPGLSTESVNSWETFKLAALRLRDHGNKSVVLAIDGTTPLTKFFPLLPKIVFENIPFTNCALDYRFDDEDGKSAGASLVADIKLQGPLQDLSRVFSTVLGQEEPILRVSAYLGTILDIDVVIDSLTLVGCFIGCNRFFPINSKVLQITSLGATISISRSGESFLMDAPKAALLPDVIAETLGSSPALQESVAGNFIPAINGTNALAEPNVIGNGALDKDSITVNGKIGKALEEKLAHEAIDHSKVGAQVKNEKEDVQQVRKYIKYCIFGSVELAVPGHVLPFSLDLDLSVSKELYLFTMAPKGPKHAWNDVFGFENIDVCLLYLFNAASRLTFFSSKMLYSACAIH